MITPHDWGNINKRWRNRM